MSFSKIEDKDEHVRSVIQWLFDEVISASGDGDGIWYSCNYSVEDIMEFIKDNSLNPWDEPTIINGNLVYSHGQECLLITNNYKEFGDRPPWQQVSLAW